MKQEQLSQIINSGAIICVGVYWAGKVDAITFRDKNAGGQRRTAYTVRETILTDTDPITVSRFLSDTEKVEEWKPSAKKNDKVVVRIQSMTVDKGAIILNGKIEALV